MSGIEHGPLEPDLKTAEHALGLLVTPANVFELRALMKDERDRQWIEFGYFDAIAPAIQALPALARKATGVYMTLNPVRPELWSRSANHMRRANKGDTTGDQHIVRRSRLLIDIDGTPVAGVSSTDLEHEKAQELACRIAQELETDGWPLGLIGDSGNGAHLVFAVDLPANDERLVERVLTAANLRWGGDGLKVDAANHNPARITKLFGTPTRKGDSTRDRPHRVSAIMSAPPRLDVVPRDLLERLASLAPAAKPSPAPRSRTSSIGWSGNTQGGADYLRRFLAKHGIDAEPERPFDLNGAPGTIWVLARCPFNSDHASGEVHVHALDSGPLGFRCKHDSCKAYGWREFREHFEPDAGRATSRPIPDGADDAGDPAVNESSSGQRRKRPAPSAPSPRDDITEICISPNITDVIDRAQTALVAAGRIYVRGRKLAHVVRDFSAPQWLQVPDGLPMISELGDARLREMMSSSARWLKYDGRSKGHVDALPPDWAPKTLKERGEWPFPVLEGISDMPVLRPDGTIHDVPGYDKRSRTIYAPGNMRWPAIKHEPNRHDAVTALAELSEPFCDFPFVDPCDQSAAIAFLLSIVGRSAIAGPVPMFKSGSNTPGAGKGLIVDTVSIIATGRESSKMAPTRDDNETRKRLLPIAIAAPPVLTFDNVEGMFGSETLAMALTTGTFRERVLGSSEDMDIPLRTVFALTGNNIQLQGDLGRRIIPIDIDPKMEHPEDRAGYRYPDLKAHVAAERPRLVVAALTLLRAYVVAGMPKHPHSAKGSFEAWDRLVRGAIIWAGGADPARGAERLREAGDIDLERLRALIGAWRCLPEREVTTFELLERAKMSPELRAAIDAYAMRGEPMDTTRLSMKLNQLCGRPCDGFRIQRGGTAHGGARKWRLDEL